MAGREVYEFGEFTLDAAERRLLKSGENIRLAPKAYDLLVALVRNCGRLVTKRQLLDLVWPEAFVEEGILSVHVSALRKALGDDLIETVARSGYRFHGAIAPTNAARLRAPEVHELIGRGRSYLLTASYWEVPKAVEAFRAAIDLDPGYAAAHAGLALACCAQAEFRVRPPAEAYGEARAAALRALAMDGECADAQVALGAALFLSEWNWLAAERSFKRALALNPNHSEAYVFHGRLLDALGRLEEGLATKFKALERDPFSAFVHLQIALSYWNQRRYDDAAEWADKALAIDPRHLLAREFLAGVYLKKGDFDRHLAESIKHAESFGVPAHALEPLKRAYAGGGRPGALKYMLERLSGNPQGVPDVQFAVLYAEAGDLDPAFRHLEKAIASHDPALVHLAVAPQWDNLRADPRFEGCLERMGLKAPLLSPVR